MQYTILLAPWEDGQGYTVVVPSLPGCIIEGATKEEALANAKEAILCHVEGLRKAGESIPSEEIIPELVRVEL
ncbi:type II toxin-antitoxin system HicB family antitoxin [Dehalococcoidales bacterium]|nr:type II toxin-antitoxin system HicB family antitoxin [Dehalococcoidales bacterium]